MITEYSQNLVALDSAVFSDDRVYRYSLTRRWRQGPVLLVCMLNPSTADAFTDDPTVRRCKGFAVRDGYGAMTVVNLYALRATNPRALAGHEDPVGPDNDTVIRRTAAEAADRVVAAWGGSGPEPGTTRRAQVVRGLLAAAGHAAQCFGTTAAGAPRHPLYLPGNTPLQPYPAQEVA